MSAVQIVLRKELRDMLRDKRVRSAMLFGPVFSVALMMMLLGVISKSVRSAKNMQIHVVEGPKGTAERSFIEGFKKAGMTVKSVESLPRAKELIAKGNAALVLEFSEPIEKRLSARKAASFNVYLDPAESRAEIALAAIQKVVEGVNDEVLRQTFVASNIPTEFLNPITVNRKEVKVGESSSGDFIVQLIPYLIIVWAFYGGLSFAGDIVSGEKERQTLETLLISPTDRKSIALGKLLALFVGGATATLAALGTLYGFYLLRLDMLKIVFEKGFGLTLTGLLVVLATMLPTILLFASMLLAISCYARNTREAQTYLAQSSLLVTLPAVFSQVIGLTGLGGSVAVSCIPILNAANVIRNALVGKYDALGISLTIGIDLLLAGVALFLSIRMFSRESILVRA